MQLPPALAKKCRQCGQALIVASPKARDFEVGLFAGTANYLKLRAIDQDARDMVRNVPLSELDRYGADRLKKLPNFEACFLTAGQRPPSAIRLAKPV